MKTLIAIILATVTLAGCASGPRVYGDSTAGFANRPYHVLESGGGVQLYDPTDTSE